MHVKLKNTYDHVKRWNLRIFISDNIAVNFLNSVVILFHEFVLIRFVVISKREKLAFQLKTSI